MYLPKEDWLVYAFLRSNISRDEANKWLSVKKKHLRPFIRKSTEYDVDWKIIWTEHEFSSMAMIEKVFYPIQFTADDIEEFKDAHWMHWYNPWDDGRDCTGVRFTDWMEFFRVPKGTWVYHHTSCDV